MGDERRNEGSGAVVAIVLILGILFLLGLIVVVGGAMVFVAVPGDMNIQMPPASTVAPVPTDLAEPAAEGLESAGPQVENSDTEAK